MSKRSFISVLVCLLCLTMLLAVSGCSLEQTVCDENKSMNYEIPDMELAAGQSRKIPSLVADNGKNSTYTLSKEGVVEIRNGTVYALADGEVTVTARIECVESIFDVVVKDRYYKLTLTNDTNKGAVKGLASEYLAGTNATLNFTPKGFYTVVSVTVDETVYNVVNNSVSFPVSANHAVTVNYTAPQYNLTINNSTSAVLTGFTAGEQDAGVKSGKLTVDSALVIPTVWVNGTPLKLTPKANQTEYDISLTLDKDTTLQVAVTSLEDRPHESATINAVVDYATRMVGQYYMYSETREILPEDMEGGSTNLNVSESSKIMSGYVYRGLPYTLGTTSLDAFLLDEVGQVSATVTNSQSVSSPCVIHQIDTSDYIGKWYINYGASCGDLPLWAWAEVCGEIHLDAATAMTADRGLWKVGQYSATTHGSSCDAECICKTQKHIVGTYVNTHIDVENNGTDVMYAAYSMLRPGDAGTCYDPSKGAGHAILITEVNVVTNGDGSINPTESYVLYHDTHSGHGVIADVVRLNGVNYPVYTGTAVNEMKTFETLFSEGYLPVTCKQLLTPNEEIVPVVTDSLQYVDAGNMLTGVVSANRPISHVTMKITQDGAVVQQATRIWAGDLMNFKVYLLGTQYHLEWSKNEAESYKLHPVDDTIDLSTLPAGNYHCTLTVTLGGGYSYDIRDFDFV